MDGTFAKLDRCHDGIIFAIGKRTVHVPLLKASPRPAWVTAVQRVLKASFPQAISAESKYMRSVSIMIQSQLSIDIKAVSNLPMVLQGSGGGAWIPPGSITSSVDTP